MMFFGEFPSWCKEVGTCDEVLFGARGGGGRRRRRGRM